MADPRALGALRRIETAFDRIEAVATRPRAAPQAPDDHDRLRAAHETLRREVGSAIAEIDRLITARAQG